jgi:hypothetical protein
MENNHTQYIANVVKLSINPIKVVKHLDNNGKETITVDEMPSKREIGIFLKHDPELISDWYVESGYHCIEISNISFKEINGLTRSEYFFLGHIVYAKYLSGKKVGYSEIENGSTNTGWFVSRKFENWDQLKTEFELSNQILDEVKHHTEKNKFCGLSLYVNHKPEKGFKVHKERVNSILDYSLDQYTLTDLKANWEKNRDYGQLCERKGFKFFVNDQYEPLKLLNSLEEVLKYDNRIGDPNGGDWSVA